MKPLLGEEKSRLSDLINRPAIAGVRLCSCAIRYIPHSVERVHWGTIYQEKTVKEIEVSCRDALEFFGRKLGKSSFDVRREMAFGLGGAKFETREDEIRFIANKLDNQFRRWFFHLVREKYSLTFGEFKKAEDENGVRLTNSDNNASIQTVSQFRKGVEAAQMVRVRVTRGEQNRG